MILSVLTPLSYSAILGFTWFNRVLRRWYGRQLLHYAACRDVLPWQAYDTAPNFASLELAMSKRYIRQGDPLGNVRTELVPLEKLEERDQVFLRTRAT
jgi:hypothetical protein